MQCIANVYTNTQSSRVVHIQDYTRCVSLRCCRGCAAAVRRAIVARCTRAQHSTALTAGCILLLEDDGQGHRERDARRNECGGIDLSSPREKLYLTALPLVLLVGTQAFSRSRKMQSESAAELNVQQCSVLYLAASLCIRDDPCAWTTVYIMVYNIHIQHMRHTHKAQERERERERKDSSSEVKRASRSGTDKALSWRSVECIPMEKLSRPCPPPWELGLYMVVYTVTRRAQGLKHQEEERRSSSRG
ncbi:unnamed protein product [Trichogramma brassicae]|uniref:Uncharacterized protein n=1 Tax=Trichogramma brassicae TaxID=86971 RepID=A0A6H5IBS7_9HYME|nr:unnamed protein product [Trichogramma brassicae]